MGKKYPIYIESEIQWIREIPKEWELIKAKWLFKEKSLKGYPNETLLSVSKGRGLLPRDQLEFKAVMAFKDLENFKLVAPNDFVIHLRSFQSGFELSKLQGIVSPAYTVFSGKELIYPRYYQYLFYTKGFIDYIAATTQSLRDGKPIAYNTFGDMELPLPAYNEQKKIAGFLNFKTDSIDLLIKEKEKLIKLLEEKWQSMITEAVTKGLNPNVKMKDSGVEWIGEIPEYWEVKKFKRCFKVVNGKEINVELDVEDQNGIDVFGSGGKFKKTNEFLYSGESVLFGRKGTIGKPLYVSGDFWVVDTMYFTKFYQDYYPKWFYYVLKIYPWHLIMTQTALPSIVGSDIENDRWCIPTYKEQKEISFYLDAVSENIDNLISDINNQIKNLKDYRQSLIYEAVTGKIDVRDFEVKA